MRVSGFRLAFSTLASKTTPSLNKVQIIEIVSFHSTIPDLTGFEVELPLFSFFAPLFQLTQTFEPSGTFEADTKVILYFCLIPFRDLNMIMRAEKQSLGAVHGCSQLLF